MQFEIVDEAHNHVEWVGRSPLLRLLVGVLVGWTVVAVFVFTAPGAQAVRVGLTVTGIALALALALTFTTPLTELGRLERTLDGGTLTRRRRWLIGGLRVAWEAPLEAVSGFQMEHQAFVESAGHTYTLARLWVVLDDGSFAPLTDWAAPDNIHELGELLAKAGRRVFEE